MLHSIEIEIDANGYIHSTEPLPTGRRGILTLFEEKTFSSELQPAANEPTQQNHFQDLFGILTAKRSVSLEEMEQAISQHALECFNDCD